MPGQGSILKKEGLEEVGMVLVVDEVEVSMGVMQEGDQYILDEDSQDNQFVVVPVVPLVVPLACTGVLLGAFLSVVQEGRELARVAHIRHLVGAHHIPVAPVSVASLAVEEVGNTGNSFLHLMKYRSKN